MKNSLLSLASLTLATALGLGGTALAADPDPLLNDQSLETFAVDMGGLRLNLPVELKARAIPKTIDAARTDLSIGNINIDSVVKSNEGEIAKTLKGWVEFEGGSKSCDVDQNIQAIRKNSLSNDVKTRLERVVNTNFDGYIATTEMSQGGVWKGLFLEAYDKKISRCFTISLAIDGFDHGSRYDIRRALTPLTSPIAKSLVDYSLQGAGK